MILFVEATPEGRAPWKHVDLRLALGLALLVALTACSRTKSEPSPTATGSAALTLGDGGAFGATCAKDSDCASGACFEKSSYCSIKCTKDSDCPSPPSTGKCAKRGYCKNKP
jgi:hypothetical protein